MIVSAQKQTEAQQVIYLVIGVVAWFRDASQD